MGTGAPRQFFSQAFFFEIWNFAVLFDRFDNFDFFQLRLAGSQSRSISPAVFSVDTPFTSDISSLDIGRFSLLDLMNEHLL